MTDGKTRHVRAGDSLSLAYNIEGAGEPLLMISGMSSDRGLWGYVRPSLNEHYRTIAFDNRDAGASDRAGAGYAMVDLARDALAVMDAADVEQAHVLGHS
ncbi:MAG: alpha/beta fold hydrolase, partial [Myxococcota bacterium]